MHLSTIPGVPRNVSGRQGRNDCRICPTVLTSLQTAFASSHILKNNLFNSIAPIERRLKNTITAMFNGIDKDVLFTVFESEMKRVKWALKHQGDYYNK
jgi:hypothetical protein